MYVPGQSHNEVEDRSRCPVRAPWRWFEKAPAVRVGGGIAAANGLVVAERWTLPALVRFGAELRRAEGRGGD
jgi:hypothetical protein